MEVIERDGKYHVVFGSQEEARLHAEAVKKAAAAEAEHKGIAASIGNLIGHLKHFGIHAEGKPPKAVKETPLAASHPEGEPVAAPEELATPGPRFVGRHIEDIPRADESAAAAEVK